MVFFVFVVNLYNLDLVFVKLNIGKMEKKDYVKDNYK